MSISDTIKMIPGYIGSNGRTEEEIVNAEKELDTSFANDYREYLEIIGLACFEGHELTGLTKTARLDVVSVTKEQRMLNQNIPRNWYVIEESHLDGIVIWQSPSGEIYQTAADTPGRKTYYSLMDYVSAI